MGKFVGKSFRAATILVLDRYPVPAPKTCSCLERISDREPHSNRGDSDKNQQGVEKGSRYRGSRLSHDLVRAGCDLHQRRTDIRECCCELDASLS